MILLFLGMNKFKLQKLICSEESLKNKLVPKDEFEHLQLVMIRVVTSKQNMGHHVFGMEDTQNMEQV